MVYKYSGNYKNQNFRFQWLRTRLLVLLWGGFLLQISISCGPRATRHREIRIFNLDSLLNIQTTLLSHSNLLFRKHTIIGDSIQSVKLENDSTGWEKEFSIFRTADIHKPGLREFYDKKIFREAPFLITEYISNDSSKTDTYFLKVFRDLESGRLKKIEAQQNIHNPIYLTRRILKLFFKNSGNNDLLDSLYVAGFQKMVTQDTVSYLTAGKIIDQQ